MQTYRVILFLCIAVFYTFGQQPEINNADPKVGDPIEDALKLLQKLQHVITEAISNATVKIDEYLDEINQAAQDIEEKARIALENATQPYLEAIDHLEEEAAKAAVDITSCIGNSVQDIEEIPEAILTNVTDCLADKLSDAKTYINNTLNDIESTADIILDLGKDIQVCKKKSFIEQPPCLVKVTIKITTDLVSLPLKIVQDVAGIGLYVVSFLPTLTQCSTDIIAEVAYKAGNIVANVTECANAKMNITDITYEYGL